MASTVMISTLFMLTGVGVALLGAVLPAILAHWSLEDRGGGLLFLLAWIGSTLGALASRGKPAGSVARGALLTALACFALIYAGHDALFPLIFCYGLGLGITMTSISLLRSQREAERRPQEMNRLNMLWALGALACPTLAEHALRTSSIAYLFAMLGCCFAVLVVWTVAVEMRFPSPGIVTTEERGMSLPPLPVLLGLISALVVGVESSIGGWLTTYVKRADHSVAGAVTATSAFWAGLLISRALHSTSLMTRLPTRRIFRLHLGLVAVCTAAVCATRIGALLLPLAFFVGFGLGPLYPLLLALVLPRFRGNRVFVMAGLGSAIFPWMTGLVSTHFGSLRAGLTVPCVAACVLVLLMVWAMRYLRGEATALR